MEILDELNSNEFLLSIKAAQKRLPLAGTFELLPHCNMNCKMCYIHDNVVNSQSQKKLLSSGQWIKIAGDAKDEGMLYLLLTGGEPLLYPQFEDLYSWLGKSGIVVILNTNGTLIDEDKADLISEYPPRRVNISLYGSSENTYERLCGFKSGFERTIRGIELLLKRSVPVKLNSSITPYNAGDLEELHRIANYYNIPLQVTTYMFPPARRECLPGDTVRLCPEEAVKLALYNAKLEIKDEGLFKKEAHERLLKGKTEKKVYPETGFSCFASKNNFWINWRGEMSPCGMLSSPLISVIKNGFSASWRYISTEAAKIKNPEKCINCDKISYCRICAASAKAETGRYDKAPDYLCQMTDAFIKELERNSGEG